MPDGSTRRHRARAPGPPAPSEFQGGIAKDSVDLRDRAYEPTLQRLPPHLDPPQKLLDALGLKELKGWKLPRVQGAEGTCGGQALAALIDIERIRADLPEPSPVSARMLYEMARRNDDSRTFAEGVSLRDVIKGFYNYGVCSDKEWPYREREVAGYLNVKRAKEARKISLGAYYRLRPNLNAYHAALQEAGSLLVSAELHDGWLPEEVARHHGIIEPPHPSARPKSDLGNQQHAFVVVGYSTAGFFVLNSWGTEWGCWPPGGGDVVQPGIALWRYEDWANSILDGWVLRLGVGAAEAFEYSVGDQGLGFADGAVRSTPVHAILGHYLHLDDGKYVPQGAYASSKVTVEETFGLLRKTSTAADGKPYSGLMLTIAGGLLGLRDAAEQIARRKPLAKEAGWYPITLLWCVDYVEQARAVLDGVFDEAQKKVGKPGPTLDRLIEDRAHGVGRAFWRDIKRAAETGARPRGPLRDLLTEAAALYVAAPRFGLRLMVESEGAFALAALLEALQETELARERAAFFQMLQSVDFVAPPLRLEQFQTIVWALDAGWGVGGSDRQIVLHVPNARQERRLVVPPYGCSYFELVNRSFDPSGNWRETPDPITCASRAHAAIADKWTDWTCHGRVRLAAIAWKGKEPAAHEAIRQTDLLYRSDAEGRLRAIVRRAAPSDPR